MAGTFPFRTALVVGAGRSGLAAARVLSVEGCAVVLSDAKAIVLPPDLPLAVKQNLRVGSGPQDETQLEGIDLVVKSPGVPTEALLIASAHARGIPVWGEIELAFRLLRNPLTAVTGTNGKTTTTALIGHIMAEAGRPVRVLGNIGTAVSEVVGELAGEEDIVIEVSSFQLEDTVEFRPEVGVFLNLTPDHLDRHGDMRRYLECKAMLFANQASGDYAVINACDPTVRRVGMRLAATPGGPQVLFFSAGGPLDGDSDEVELKLTSWAEAERLYLGGRRSLAIGDLSLRGRHNVENCLAAATAALARGVDLVDVERGLRTFPGVPHRLERAGEVAGVEYVNDSKATNVDSVLKALEAYPERVHLIAGGRDKGSDYTPLVRRCAGSCRTVYLVGEAAPLIAEVFAEVRRDEPEVGLPHVRFVGDLERAVAEAAQTALPGDTVLLAPACASFDQYANFEERGRHFMDIVERMKESRK